MNTSTAADVYAALLDAITAQQVRTRTDSRPGARWDGSAAFFRMDPRRALDPNLTELAAYVQPDDVLVDVGGGAGRVCLPLALRCREVINVEPSTAMRDQFVASAAEAGITNARVIDADWPATEPVEGDVVMTANVTYFVRDIVPFVEAMQRAARRRVIIQVWNVPPPMQAGAAFRAIFGEQQEPVPSYRELLPVLWEMGILPDVRVLPLAMRRSPGWPAQSREDAVTASLRRLNAPDEAHARAMIDACFDDVIEQDESGYWPAGSRGLREMVITWETGESGVGSRESAG
ncbi:MAG: class I SAM-dependent methyltransferase [Chloroflexi bacterium]|nr:class I SAM-dependent methyltransferase [Chloroflexota bacterium]